MTGEPDYDRMPVAEADRRIQKEISRHRDRMGRLRRRRGQRLQLELDAGRTATEVAAELGTSAQVVYELTREARLGQPSPQQWWEELSDDDRVAFAAAASRPLGLAEELARRLRDAGVLVAYVGWQGQEMEAVFPREYAAHALAASESPFKKLGGRGPDTPASHEEGTWP